MMVESFIEAGNQPIPADLSKLRYGCSVTDACVGWDTTVEMLRARPRGPRGGAAGAGAPGPMTSSAARGRPRPSLARFAWLSIAAAVVTIALKTAAWLLTGSVGLLSDAAESVVNLVAAVTTLGMLTVAARPPDEDHAYGHDKAEYFASGVEGALIIVGRRRHRLVGGEPAPPPGAHREARARPAGLHRAPRSSTSWWPGSSSAPGASTTPSRSRPTPTTS